VSSAHSLVEIPENPIPPGAESLYLAAPSDGLRLRCAYWRVAKPRGTILLLHGRTEFIEKYFETISDLVLRDFNVVTMDWRGQGLSGRMLEDRRRGHIRDFAQYRDDLQFVVETLVKRRLPGPLGVVAHSMGGGITLDALGAGVLRPDFCVLSAPMAAINPGMPEVLVKGLARTAVALGMAGGFAFGQAGSRTLGEGFEVNKCTTDRARFDRTQAVLMAEPKLEVAGLTWGWLNAAFALTDRVTRTEHVQRIVCPLTIVSAGREALVDNDAHRLIKKHRPATDLVTVSEALHELMMEADPVRAQFLAAFDKAADAALSEGKVLGM